MKKKNNLTKKLWKTYKHIRILTTTLSGKIWEFLTNVEVWGIMSTLILQDGPFLVMRLYVMISRNVIHQMIVFFTIKNIVVFMLQVSGFKKNATGWCWEIKLYDGKFNVFYLTQYKGFRLFLSYITWVF